MNAKRASAAMLLFLVVLFLSGCVGRGGRNDDVTSISTDFHTGTQGVYMRFMPKAPPQVIYDAPAVVDNEIVVVAELHNRGAVDTDVNLFLGGFDASIIDLPVDYGEPIRLIGRSIYNSEGEIKVVQFPSPRNPNRGGIRLPDTTDRYQPKLQLTACYEYWTEASPIVCVSPDPYRITSEQTCRPGNVRGTFGGQGAPVAISGVKAEVIPGEVIFKIGITNAGRGRVVDWQQARRGGRCPFQLEYLDLNIIDYEVTFQGVTITSDRFASSSSESSQNCQPSVIKLSNGRATLYCRFPVTSAQLSTYETPVQINLHYGYMDSITRTLDIRRIA